MNKLKDMNYINMFFDNENSINHKILKDHFRRLGLMSPEKPKFGNWESLLCPDCYAKGWNYQDFATKVKCRRCKGAGRIFKEARDVDQKNHTMSYFQHFRINIKPVFKCIILVMFHLAHAILPIKLTEHKKWGIGT